MFTLDFKNGLFTPQRGEAYDCAGNASTIFSLWVWPAGFVPAAFFLESVHVMNSSHENFLSFFIISFARSISRTSCHLFSPSLNILVSFTPHSPSQPVLACAILLLDFQSKQLLSRWGFSAGHPVSAGRLPLHSLSFGVSV